MISKFLQILGLQPRISKDFLNQSKEQIFFTVGQNNFGNKIPKGWTKYFFFDIFSRNFVKRSRRLWNSLRIHSIFIGNSPHKRWWLVLKCSWSPSYISVYLPWFVICELFISNTKPKELLRMNHLYFTYYRNISDHSTKIRLGFSISYYF